MNHKSLWLSVLLVAIISTASHFLDFGHGLQWMGFDSPQDFLLMLLRLLFLSMVVERIVELYVIVYRAPGRIELEANIANDQQDVNAKLQLELYKAETGKQTAWVGFAIGVLMAVVGIRIFTGMFDFEDASILQIVLFDMLELFTMGALMAGGSKGINQLVSAVEVLAQRPKKAM